MKNHTSNKVDECIQFNGVNEIFDMNDDTKIKKFKVNVLEKDKFQNKIFKKGRSFIDNENSLFSNDEIKKYINDNDKSNIKKGNDYFPKKMKNRNMKNNNHGIYGTLIMNKKCNKDFLLNGNKIFKEESTNTYNTYINNYESENKNLDSFDSNKINLNPNSKRSIFKDKTPPNKRINNFIFNDNTKMFDGNKINEIKRKVNNIYNLSIENNINFNQERNNNNIKNYMELYNFHLLQSLIQNRSNLFKLKNNSLFSKKNLKNPRSINLSLFLNNTNIYSENKLSLRELYRNLNDDKLALNILKINSIKKNSQSKKRKKTFDIKNKMHNDIFGRNTNHNKLMNVQYNLDGFYKKGRNRNKNRNSIFQKTFFEKSIYNINNNIFKSENTSEKKSEYQSRKYRKTTTNFYHNEFSNQIKTMKDDVLGKGLSNSPPYIKNIPKCHLNKIKNNRNTFSDLKIKI